MSSPDNESSTRKPGLRWALIIVLIVLILSSGFALVIALGPKTDSLSSHATARRNLELLEQP